MIRKRYTAVIAQLCPTSGTRTPVNQYLGEGFKPSTFSPECLQGKALMHSIRAFFMAKRVLAQCLGLKTAKNASRSGFLCLVKPPPTGPPILA
jgi:hypothetical protein